MTETNDRMTQTVDLTVIGEERIHCQSCEQRVSNALRRLDGVQDIRASAQTQQVEVRFDPSRVQPEQIQAKLERMGYEVTGGTT